MVPSAVALTLKEQSNETYAEVEAIRMKSTLIGDFILQIPEIKTEIRHPRTPDGTDSGTGSDHCKNCLWNCEKLRHQPSWRCCDLPRVRFRLDRLAGSDAKAVVG